MEGERGRVRETEEDEEQAKGGQIGEEVPTSTGLCLQ